MKKAALVQFAMVALVAAACLEFGRNLVAASRSHASSPAPAPQPGITDASRPESAHAAHATAPAAAVASPFGDPPADEVGRRGWEIAVSGNPSLSTPCAVCHGVDGSGRQAAGIPRLAAQEPSYLVKQLEDYQSGRREHFTMQPVAESLSADDIAAVAAYYSSLPSPRAIPGMHESRTLALGTWIADKGIPERGVPACASCHGKDGIGVPPMFPRLHGQSAAYIKRQFHDLRKGQRQNDPGGLMRHVASQLSPEEIRSVAAYFEYLGGTPVGAAATD
jgi:cytochrome c553